MFDGGWVVRRIVPWGVSSERRWALTRRSGNPATGVAPPRSPGDIGRGRSRREPPGSAPLTVALDLLLDEESAAPAPSRRSCTTRRRPLPPAFQHSQRRLLPSEFVATRRRDIGVADRPSRRRNRVTGTRISTGERVSDGSGGLCVDVSRSRPPIAPGFAE